MRCENDSGGIKTLTSAIRSVLFFVDKLLISTFKHEQNRKKLTEIFFLVPLFDDNSTLKIKPNYVNGFYFSKIKGGLLD